MKFSLEVEIIVISQIWLTFLKVYTHEIALLKSLAKNWIEIQKMVKTFIKMLMQKCWEVRKNARRFERLKECKNMRGIMRMQESWRNQKYGSSKTSHDKIMKKTSGGIWRDEGNYRIVHDMLCCCTADFCTCGHDKHISRHFGPHWTQCNG